MKQNKNFTIIGVAGFIAKRHVAAIKDTGNNLIAAIDKSDNVGFLDAYFPEADFFTEFERFDRHIEKLKRQGIKTDYVSICSPNYLHDAHIRFALRVGADAICEKPVVLNPWNVDALQEIEKETNRKVYTILQLRIHPSIIKLKQEINSSSLNPDKLGQVKLYDIDLTYITSRGKWYDFSWKGDIEKSGGIATNIGIHFFDMLIALFGDAKQNIVHISEKNRIAGFLQLQKANVRWLLSTDFNDLPKDVKEKNQRTYRTITINNSELEFSQGFTDLHTESYRQILSGNGFGLDEARKSIEMVYKIRNSIPVGIKGDYHPFLLADSR